MPKDYGRFSDLYEQALYFNDKLAQQRLSNYETRTSGLKNEEAFIQSYKDKGQDDPFAATADEDDEYNRAEAYAANQELITGRRTLKGWNSNRGDKSVFSKVGGKESKRNKAMLKQIDAHRTSRNKQIQDMQGK